MVSWMSANYIRLIIILLIVSVGCVPPAYRHKNNSTQKPYQQFNYSDEDSIPIITDQDNYYIKNEYYSTQPVYYSSPQVDSTDDYKNSQSNEKNYNKKSPSKGTWHTIKKGETLYRLSKQYNTSVDAICDANNIKNSTAIKVGQKIYIPQDAPSNTALKTSSPASLQTKERTGFSFIWPVPSVLTYTHDGGVRPIGIIITSRPKSKVVASAPGTIAKIGVMRGFGNFVVIMHKKDFYTIYSRLDEITVKEGQSVPKGTTIGFLSNSNPSLHFQINHSGKPLDPLHYLAQK